MHGLNYSVILDAAYRFSLTRRRDDEGLATVSCGLVEQSIENIADSGVSIRLEINRAGRPH